MNFGLQWSILMALVFPIYHLNSGLVFQQIQDIFTAFFLLTLKNQVFFFLLFLALHHNLSVCLALNCLGFFSSIFQFKFNKSQKTILILNNFSKIMFYIFGLLLLCFAICFIHSYSMIFYRKYIHTDMHFLILCLKPFQFVTVCSRLLISTCSSYFQNIFHQASKLLQICYQLLVQLWNFPPHFYC